MPPPLPVVGYDWVKDLSKIDEDFIKSYDKDSDERNILGKIIEYSKSLHNLHSDLAFLPERMKVDKCNKLVCKLF